MIKDIDPEMHYCPQCNDEYMPERTNCGVCGAPLISGTDMLGVQQGREQQKSSRKGALTPDDDIVTIFKASLLDVKRLEQQLVEENIGTLIVGEKNSCGQGCCGGGELELRVRREDAMAGLAIIDADFKRQTASHGTHDAVADYVFDPTRVQNCCPACGTIFSTAAQGGSQGLTCPDCGLCFG